MKNLVILGAAILFLMIAAGGTPPAVKPANAHTLAQQTPSIARHVFWGDGCPACTRQQIAPHEVIKPSPSGEAEDYIVWQHDPYQQGVESSVAASDVELHSFPTVGVNARGGTDVNNQDRSRLDVNIAKTFVSSFDRIPETSPDSPGSSTDTAPVSRETSSNRGPVLTLLTTFGLIFIAELGDKTQLAVLTQTCKFRSPWSVFVGGSLALTVVTALGAAGGSLLSNVLPMELIRYIAAAAFVAMGFLIWREAMRSTENNDCEVETTCTHNPHGWNWKAFSATFSLLFLAELGDKTQLAVLGLASKNPAPWMIFAGGSLALIAVTALGVVGGQQLCRWIPQKHLLRFSAAAFVVMGVLMAFGVL